MSGYAFKMAAQTIDNVTASSIWAPAGGNGNILEGVVVHNNHATAILYVDVFRSDVSAADAAVSEVATTNGVPIGPGTSLSFDLRVGDDLRGISDTGSTGIRIAVLRGG